MWRNIARFSKAAGRTGGSRRCLSTAIPGPCIVHKRGSDILHDPWFNKVIPIPLINMLTLRNLVDYYYKSTVLIPLKFVSLCRTQVFL